MCVVGHVHHKEGAPSCRCQLTGPPRARLRRRAVNVRPNSPLGEVVCRCTCTCVYPAKRSPKLCQLTDHSRAGLCCPSTAAAGNRALNRQASLGQDKRVAAPLHLTHLANLVLLSGAFPAALAVQRQYHRAGSPGSRELALMCGPQSQHATPLMAPRTGTQKA